MSHVFSITFIAGGAVMVFFGSRALNSFGTDSSRLFIGEPTGTAVWILMGGTLAVLIGIVGFIRRSKD